VRIVHIVGASLVRNTPARTARYWGTHTEHTGTAICIAKPEKPPFTPGRLFKEPLLNPYGYYCCAGKRWRSDQKLPAEAEALIERADVLHFHDDGYPSMIASLRDRKDKIMVYQGHIGDLASRVFGRCFDYDKRVKHACITNGYGRIFDEAEKKRRTPVKWGRLADVLEIDHPLFMPPPEPRPLDGPLRVVYTFSNRAARGARINAKAPDETKALVQGIKGVDFQWVTNVSFERSMDYKRWAHVVLDEVFTPYTNLSTLEGACAGSCVLVNFDDYTRNDLCDWLGAPRESYPFTKVTPETLRDTIEALRDRPEVALERGRTARAWIERWYGTRRLLERYVEFYRS